jgi:RNA polymerase sigma-70 factor (ECF subfamily)
MGQGRGDGSARSLLRLLDRGFLIHTDRPVSPSFLLPPKARRTHESRNVVPGRSVSSPVIDLGRESIMTTPRGNHAKIARAAAAQSTPEAQFQRMYQENRDLIYHYVLNWVGNHEDAEDLTADIFLRAVGRVDYEHPTTTIRRWLFQVARTALADHWRKRYRFITCSLEELLASDEKEALEEEAGESYTTRAHRLQQLLRTRLSISPPPEEYLDEDGEERTEDNSATARVERLLQALPAPYRDVLTCRFLLNLSIRETARHMGLTVANVKVMQSRALKRAAELEVAVTGC